MHGSGHGIKFETPMYQDKNILVRCAFVDKNNIVEGYLTNTEITIEDVHIRMKKNIDIWEGRLKYTGGSIRPDKSFIYPISFTWNNQCDYSFENP